MSSTIECLNNIKVIIEFARLQRCYIAFIFFFRKSSKQRACWLLKMFYRYNSWPNLEEFRSYDKQKKVKI